MFFDDFVFGDLLCCFISSMKGFSVIFTCLVYLVVRYHTLLWTTVNSGKTVIREDNRNRSYVTDVNAFPRQ